MAQWIYSSSIFQIWFGGSIRWLCKDTRNVIHENRVGMDVVVRRTTATNRIHLKKYGRCKQLSQPPTKQWYPFSSDVIMDTMASQITSLTIVYLTIYSGTDQRKHQSSTSRAFVRGINRWPVNFPHKGPVTRKMFLNLMTSPCSIWTNEILKIITIFYIKTIHPVKIWRSKVSMTLCCFRNPSGR